MSEVIVRIRKSPECVTTDLSCDTRAVDLIQVSQIVSDNGAAGTYYCETESVKISVCDSKTR